MIECRAESTETCTIFCAVLDVFASAGCYIGLQPGNVEHEGFRYFLFVHASVTLSKTFVLLSAPKSADPEEIECECRACEASGDHLGRSGQRGDKLLLRSCNFVICYLYVQFLAALPFHFFVTHTDDTAGLWTADVTVFSNFLFGDFV